jgi:sulfite dehydrogenase (cytochrome) subunit B
LPEEHTLNLIARIAVASLGCPVATMAGGAEAPVKLKEAEGVELVRTHCAFCHSLDYVQMNSPFLNHAGWEAEVRKMMKVMGAQIPEPDVAPIVDYLAKHYGVE